PWCQVWPDARPDAGCVAGSALRERLDEKQNWRDEGRQTGNDARYPHAAERYYVSGRDRGIVRGADAVDGWHARFVVSSSGQRLRGRRSRGNTQNSARGTGAEIA